VTWLIAEADLRGLAHLLQLRLDVRLPDGRIALLRFWEPRVLANLVNVFAPPSATPSSPTFTNGTCCATVSAYTSGESMLRLDERQWQALQACDANQFGATVCDQFLATRPELVEEPGRAETLGRMQAAHDYAERIGFTSVPHIVWLMYVTADAPTLVTDSIIETYLRKPGATPKQRLDDLQAVLQKETGRGALMAAAAPALTSIPAARTPPG